MICRTTHQNKQQYKNTKDVKIQKILRAYGNPQSKRSLLDFICMNFAVIDHDWLLNKGKIDQGHFPSLRSLTGFQALQQN